MLTAGVKFQPTHYGLAFHNQPLFRPPVKGESQPPSLRRVLTFSGLGYFSVPYVTIKNRLAELRGAPLATLLSAAYCAHRLKTSEFCLDLNQWREISGLSKTKSLIESAEETLSDVLWVGRRRYRAHIILVNPITHREVADEQMEEDIAERHREDKEPRSRKYTTDQLESLVCQKFPDAVRDGDNLMVPCPFCLDPTRGAGKRSMGIRCDLGAGVFNCFDCHDGKNQTVFHLIARMEGVTAREIEARLK